jgi:hypothetical protein
MVNQSNRNLRLATFVAEALELDESPESLASEIEVFKDQANAGISTVELESSAGIMAFLLYHYDIDVMGEDGKSGGELFDHDLKTIERATKLDTPGPRILAHAVQDGEAYILATSPATHRLLTGSESPTELPIPKTAEEAERLRKDAAAGLVDTLKTANHYAASWLAAVRGPETEDSRDKPQDRIDFTDEESELALYLLDQANVRELLHVMNLMIESTKSVTNQE